MHLQAQDSSLLATGSVLVGRRENSIVDILARLIGRAAAASLVRRVGVNGIQQFDASTLVENGGISLRLAERVVAARSLAVSIRSHRTPKATCPADLFKALPADLVHLEREVLLGVALTASNDIKAIIVLSVGGVAGTSVVSRDVFIPMVRHAAAACILVHNHPSGDPTPSADDVEFTRVLAGLGALLGVPVVDHLIVGRDGYRSLRELELLPNDEAIAKLARRK